MSLEENDLRSLVEDKYNEFKKEAGKHRNIFRGGWMISTLISLLIAMFNFSGISSLLFVSGLLAIVLPVIIGYLSIRSPEKLWIFETDVRNQLDDLRNKINMDKEGANRLEHQTEYFEIMKNANKRWVAIKQNA